MTDRGFPHSDKDDGARPVAGPSAADLDPHRVRELELQAMVERLRAAVERADRRVAALRAEQERAWHVANQAQEGLRLREDQLHRLGEHTRALQRRVRSLLQSRRWRISNVMGDVKQRLLLTVPRSRESELLAGMIGEGFELLDDVVLGVPAPFVAPLPDVLGPTAPRQAPGIRSFAEYLAHAMTLPLIEAPFTESDRRVLGVMDSRRRQLAARYAQRPQDTLVSVILPASDHRGVLARAIASVRAQRYANWELLVVDGAGADDTVAYVGSIDDDRVRCVPLPTDGGVAAARNAGLEVAGGDVVSYLDPASTWHPDYLLVMVGALADASWADVAYCAQEIYDTSDDVGRPYRALQAMRFAPFNRSLLEHRNYVGLSAFVHTRAIADRLGGFDTTLPRLADWDLLLRYTAEKGACAVPCVLSTCDTGAVGDQPIHSGSWSDAFDQLERRSHAGDLELEVPPQHGDGARLRPLVPTVTATTYRSPVTIVIPSFEALPYLQLCIRSVEAYTDVDHQLVVVDNGSGSDVRAYLGTIAGDPNVEVILNDDNLGFTHAVNMGMDAAGPGRDVILLNNDAVVTPGWVQGMWEVFDRVNDVGLVAPRQTLVAGTPTMGLHVPYSRSDRELDVTLSRYHDNVVDPLLDPTRGLVEMTFVPFFCVYVPRTTIDAVGTLNAQNAPHYRSDRLYCDMIRQFAGKKVVYTPHAKLYHFLRRSTTQLRQDDPELYQQMVVRNDWHGVRARAEEAGRADAR